MVVVATVMVGCGGITVKSSSGDKDAIPPATDDASGDSSSPADLVGDDPDSGEATEPDATEADASEPDAAEPDMIEPDAEGPDSATTDTEAPDTASPDATPDATPQGCTTDADCAAVDHGPCEAVTCDLGTGKCKVLVLSEGAACDDGSACTLSDSCKSGACTGTAKDCADTNPCTADGCDAATGDCTYPAVPDADAVSCDDGSACTDGDVCKGGACTGGTKVCECAIDAECDDGNACNGSETCVAGAPGTLVCKSGEAVKCGPTGNPCTQGACDPASGACQPIPINEGDACGPDDACVTIRICVSGACTGTPVACVPASACFETTGCDPLAGCLFAPLTGQSCDDKEPCTSSDVCAADGSCTGKAVDCDDLEPCTKDSCTPGTGCKHAAVTDGDTCDLDADACTADSCWIGKCTSGPKTTCNDGVPCTKDACVPADGTCTYTPEDSACVDSDPCTSDTCDKSAGCQHVPLKDFDWCNDGDDVTTPDFCFQGSCLGGEVSEVETGVLTCTQKNVRAAGASFVGSVAYFAGNYDAELSGTTGCNGKFNAYTTVYQVTSSGASTASLSMDGVARDMVGGVIVGDSGLVREFGSKGAFDYGWNKGPLSDAVKELSTEIGNDDEDLLSVSMTTLQFGVTYYLIGGHVGGAFPSGWLGLCGSSAFGTSCSDPNVTKIPTSWANASIQATALSSNDDNDGISVSFVGSQSTGKTFDFYIDGFDANEFILAKSFASPETLNGAVMQDGLVAWFYGSGGYLFRCAGYNCADLSTAVFGLGQEHYDFVDAVAYKGSVVFLAANNGETLVALQDPLAEEFGSSYAKIGLNMTHASALALDPATGALLVVGENETKTKYVVQSFFK